MLSVENLIHNVRWRVFHFLHPNSSNQKETYGFNSLKKLPTLAELKCFENGLHEIVKSVKFRPFSDPFQDKMRENQKKNME